MSDIHTFGPTIDRPLKQAPDAIAPAHPPENAHTRTDPHIDWLILSYLPGVGPAKFHQLLEWFGSPRATLEADAKLLGSAGLRTEALQLIASWQKNPQHCKVAQQAEADLVWMQKHRAQLVLLDDADYPYLLKQIHQPPPVLFIQGDRSLLGKPQLAMVGSRHASTDGMDNARHFAKSIAEQGITLTSGLAMGIDAAAHAGALKAGGTTVAVMGTGLDLIYPASHHKLAQSIIEQGLLVTEFPPGTRPMASNFPRRNRIISGLALGVIVIEASLKSGSLITARHALEQGREVFAIPGSIHNPMAKGCHQLIRDGAKLVQSIDDIVEELADIPSRPLQMRIASARPLLPLPPPPEFPQIEAAGKALLMHMGYETVSIDLLVERSGLSPAQLMQELLLLEINGLIETVPGGYKRLAGISCPP